jgi:acetolactate synthase-1/2/3 large subunit
MADAYYKIKHEPVATFTSCGPGSCNIVIALANAMMDSSAYLAITGQRADHAVNRMPFQETGRYYQGDFRRHPAVREAQLPAHARRHGAARDETGLRAAPHRTSRAQ